MEYGYCQKQRKVYASFDAIKDKKFPLTFREMSTQADETTHAYKIRFTLPTIKDYIILPGMTATVVADSVPTADKQSKNEIFWMKLEKKPKPTKHNAFISILFLYYNNHTSLNTGKQQGKQLTFHDHNYVVTLVVQGYSPGISLYLF